MLAASLPQELRDLAEALTKPWRRDWLNAGYHAPTFEDLKDANKFPGPLVESTCLGKSAERVIVYYLFARVY